MEKSNKLHWSKYNIYNEADDYICVFHGYTGAMNCIEKNKYELIKYDNFTEEKANTILGADSVKKLKDRGILTTLSKDEEHKNVVTFGNVLSKKEEKIFTVTFLVTYYCNFRCPYCFENSSCGDRNSLKNTTITKETVDDVFKYIDKQLENGKKLSGIALFGGEPLLKENREIIEYIVKKAAEYNVKVNATTNGYDLDSFFDLVEDGYIHELNITLDGVNETHNCTRCHETDPDSFSKIVSNIDHLLNSSKVFIALRGNIDRQNIDNIKQLIDFYTDKKWNINERCTYYFKSIHDCYEENDNKKINDYILGSMVEDNIKYDHIGYYRRIKKVLIDPILKGELPIFSTEVCKSSGEMFVVDYKRNVYPCWERINEEESVIGRFSDKGEFIETANYSYWKNRKSHNMLICSNCPYVFLCCGNCPSHTFVSYNDIYKNNCNGSKQCINEYIIKLAKDLLAQS